MVQAPIRVRSLCCPAIVVLAALIRLPSLLHDGLWRDDANVYVELLAPSFREFLHRVTQIEYHPPLYFCIVYAWTKYAGLSELSLKLLPFIFSLLAVPIVFLLGKEAVSRCAGLVAAAMYAVAPLPVVYSTFYLYPLALFSFTTVAWLVIRQRRRSPTVTGWVAVAAASFVAVGTHYMALLYLPLLGLWALASPRGCRRGIVLASAIAVGMLAFAAWLPVLLGQLRVGVPYEGPTSIADKLTFLTIALLQLLPVRLATFDWTVFLVLVCGALVVTGKSVARSDAGALGAIVLAAVIADAAANLRQVRYVEPFYGLLCVFFAASFVLLAARLAAEHSVLTRRWGTGIACLLSAVFLGGDVAFALENSAVPRSGIRTFAASGPPTGSTLFVLAPDYLAPTFAFYTRGLPVRFIGFPRVVHPEIFTLAGYEASWSAPHAVDNTLAAIARESKTGTFRYLDVIVQDDVESVGYLDYGRTWDLLRAVELRYKLLGRTRYSGKWEFISVYQFAL